MPSFRDFVERSLEALGHSQGVCLHKPCRDTSAPITPRLQSARSPAHPAQRPCAMAPLTTNTHTLLRSCARHSSPALRAPASAIQRRGRADVIQRATAGQSQQTSSFDSPFRGAEGSPTTKIPSFGKYMAKGGETTNKVFSYFMVGTLGAITAMGAKATVQGQSTGRSRSARRWIRFLG